MKEYTKTQYGWKPAARGRLTNRQTLRAITELKVDYSDERAWREKVMALAQRALSSS